MKRLGFDTRSVFDLILLTLLSAILFGKLFSPFYYRVFLSKLRPSLQFITEPVFIPAALFFGLLAFFWYCNRKKWSVFEVADQATWPFIIGHLAFTIYYLLNKFIGERVKVFNIADTALTLGEALLVLLNLFVFNKKISRGLRLFLNLLVLSLVLMINDKFQMTNTTNVLTFYILTIILSLVGIFQRLKKKIMFGSSDILTKLKHRLLARKNLIKEQQLKLPQDDPFLEPGRANNNSPEEDENEQVGHRDVLAQTEFLAQSQKQVEAALSKMEKGTYGICEKCGAKIEEARLEADPAATLCIKCAK